MRSIVFNIYLAVLLSIVSFVFAQESGETDVSGPDTDAFDEYFSDSNNEEEDPFDSYFTDYEDELIEDTNMIVTTRRFKFNLNENIDPRWIESIIFIETNKEYTLGELQRLIDKSKSLLMSMQMFYSVNIYLLPAILDPSKRTVVIELSDGFWYFFNFYPWVFTIEFRQLFKTGKQLRLDIGNNRQSVTFIDNRVAFSDFQYSASLSHSTYKASAEEGNYLLDVVNFNINPGVLLAENLFVNLRLNANYYSFPQSYFLFPTFEYTLPNELTTQYGVDQSKLYLSSGLSLSADFNKLYVEKLFGFRLDLIANYNYSMTGSAGNYISLGLYPKLFMYPHKNIIVAARMYAAYNSIDTYQFLKYDLNNHFRGFSSTNTGDYYTSIQFDINLKDLFVIPLGVFYIDFKPFIYGDIGRAFQNNEAFALEGYSVAFGGGVHVYFSSPVNMYFTFGVKNGITQDGVKSGFLFNVTSGLFLYD